MALHTYNLTQLKAAAEQALGKSSAGDVPLERVVNDALAELADMHPWAWREAVLSVDFVGGQDYADLPADFAQSRVMQRKGGLQPLILCSPQEIFDRREAADIQSNGTGAMWAAIVSQPQASATDTPTRRLILYPTPAADEAGAIVGMYYRAIPRLTNDTDLPDIDPQHHPLLAQLVRVRALEQDGQDATFEAARFQTLLAAAMSGDGVIQQTVGRMRGGLRTSRLPLRAYPHAGIQKI